jgi:dinuclear metal center YbgI/SA1388 family protein
MTVQAVLDWLDAQAPFSSQEEYDNGGLLTGSPDREVSGVLVCLDVTEAVIREAGELGANLVVAHHPLLFTPIKTLNEQGYAAGLLARLVRENVSLVAAHTSMDKSAAYSGSAALARLLGLADIRRQGEYVFVGSLPRPMKAEELKRHIAQALGAPVLRFGDEEILIRTLGVAGGAYSEGFREAREAGAQGFLTGEVRHHHAVEAVSRGMALFGGGHLATEAVMLAPLAQGLQEYAGMLQYPVRVHVSRNAPYRLG